MRRTHEPQSVPALLAEAICRGLHAPFSACSLTCFSVMPKHEQTYTRFTSGGISRAAVSVDRAAPTFPVRQT
jgi:hypothetical protein